MEQIASILAPVATTVAALIVASNFGARTTGYGFIIFTIGSLAWAALGAATGQPNLLWQNVILTALNLFGVWRWLGRQARIEEGSEAASRESHQQHGEDLFPISLLNTAPIAAADGEDVGSCVDAMAGCGSGRIRYLVFSEGGVAGVGETLRRMSWSQCRVSAQRVITTLNARQMHNLQLVEPDHWPAR